MLQPCAGGKAGRARCAWLPLVAALLDDFGHGPTQWKAQMFIFEAMDMGPHMASMTDTTVEDL